MIRSKISIKDNRSFSAEIAQPKLWTNHSNFKGQSAETDCATSKSRLEGKNIEMPLRIKSLYSLPSPIKTATKEEPFSAFSDLRKREVL
jgi:hypothetical protein